MAVPPSSSSYFADREYDVYLSFCDYDTCKNFVACLYAKLKSKRIHTFIYDVELEKETPRKLVPHDEAIEKSKIAIVVLSENYAFFGWYLDELVKIVNCRETTGQIILPIFYKVYPIDVMQQTGIFAKAFKEHQKNFELDKLQNWRKALSKVGSLSGWELENCFRGDEATLVECVVEEVSDKLTNATDLVGMESHMMEVNELLDFECKDVQFFGIWGIGGIGKSAIARFIFQRHSRLFDATCYLLNISKEYRAHGALYLQRKLLSQVLDDFDQDIYFSKIGCRMMCERLFNKKVLIVLDDVDDLMQLKALANSPMWFGCGSRVIITTRDKHLLYVNGVHSIYEVKTLDTYQSLQLFCRYAFKQNQPKKNFLKLSNDFITYAKGLPLTLKVLGTSLYGMKIDEWKSALEMVNKNPPDDVYHVLVTSFDGLEESIQVVFLSVALFFIGKEATRAKTILNRYGWFPTIAFSILRDKALLTISENNKLYMHNMIREMAHRIVRESGEKSALHKMLERISKFDVEMDDINTSDHTINKLLCLNRQIAIGSNGTVVYEGFYKGRFVAVKRLIKSHYNLASKEIDALIELDNHQNIVRYYGSEKDDHFVYIALEFCICNLDEMIYKYKANYSLETGFVSGEQIGMPIEHRSRLKLIEEKIGDLSLWKTNGKPSSELLKLMRGLVSGLAHLHKRSIVHRDLKPQNVLITIVEESQACAKLSDMGISKHLCGDKSSLDRNATGCGSSGWQAPEQLRRESQTKAIDIFSLGCVLFYSLTGGYHPFGNQFERDNNILNDQVNLSLLNDIPEAQDLISSLLNPDPKKRPKASKVLLHPMFWDSDRKLSFLHDAVKLVANAKQSNSNLLSELEGTAPKVLGGSNWNEKIHPAFKKNIENSGKYNYNSVKELVRAIRNKHEHYVELPEQIKKLLDPLPDGYYDYFAIRFPNLFFEVYKVFSSNREEGDCMEKYFL